MAENQSHLRGENGFSGRFDLFGAPLKQIRPEFAPTKLAESLTYDERAKGRNGANSPPAVGGEKGESSKELALTPLPTPHETSDTELVVKQPTADIVSPMEQFEVVSRMEQSDPYELHLAKRTRHWFGQGVSLTFRETDGATQGRDRYACLWAEVAR